MKTQVLITLMCGIFSLAGNGAFAQTNPFTDFDSHSPEEQRWVDSVFNTLTPDQRIAQLFMAAAYSNRDISHEDHILQLIREQHIGGLIFFQGTPEKQTQLINYYQSQSEVPLLIAMDAEWGPGMRLEGVPDFPYQMTLGAIQDDSLIYTFGTEVARELRRLGIHMNFAPVVDINNNPENPVINFRSFGMDRENVTQKARMYLMGMQEHGVVGTLKHFPGHGDTDTDSHLALPVIRKSREALANLELYPFRELINAGAGAVMVAHLNIPSLDPTKNLPSTLSRPIVTDLLRNELGFSGLVVTDAMNMHAVADSFPPGIADVRALQAGNDLVEFSMNIPSAIEGVKQAVKSGTLTEAEVDKKVRKILTLKYRVGLNHNHPIHEEHILADLNTVETYLLNRQLSEAAVTLLRNEEQTLPVGHLEEKKIAGVVLGAEEPTHFQLMLQKYTRVDLFNLDKNAPAAETARLLDTLQHYNFVILGLQNLSQRPHKNFGITQAMITTVQKIIDSKPTATVFFGNPFALAKIPALGRSAALLLTYQETEIMQDIAAQMVFGAISIKGRLPVTVSDEFQTGDGIDLAAVNRLRYNIPESVGMDSHFLEQKIDSIAEAGITAGAFPGCQVLVARNGTVVFHKTYGYHTYAKRQPVAQDDLYDFASVTKVTGPLPALMRLHDQGKFQLDVPFYTYWPKWKHSNKKEVMVRDVLAHQARLKSWIPYWRNTVRNGHFKWHTFSLDSSDRYNVYVAPRIFLNKNYRNKIYRAIRKSPLEPEKKYLYSGLSFYLYPQIIKNLTGYEYPDYVRDSIYRPLGAYTLTFNPYKDYELPKIVPTENDTFFRKEQLHGWVHDEGAAMMGGISGNAGLFGTANDLAKLAQMYLQMGEFGGRRFISDSTMHEFTRCQFPENGNRRGLGFDKPKIKNATLTTERVYPAQSASPSSFGHSGYTGTFFWADPDTGLLYIFFSNRVYPTRYNSKIYDLNIRTSIHQVIYDAVVGEK